MINITNKLECCGCESCVNICPQHCILMKSDNEGFLYPETDINNCINCGLCEKACPIINKKDRFEVKKAYVLQLKNQGLRVDSSSGGAFTAIADYVLNKNGTIYGVAFDEKMNVVHRRVTTFEDLKFLRGSKYVQSRIGNIYSAVKADLDAKVYVLFTGTPCQIEGLINYLRKPYDNLITADLVCHGVPSPKVWKKYILDLEKKYNSKVVGYSFRSKKTGFHDFGTEIVFEDGSVRYTHDKGEEKDFMHLAFFQEICSRPSCHACNFKTAARRSDFTLFDCWHVSEFDNSMEDDLGTSALLIHTERANQIINEISSLIKYKEVDIKRVIELDGNNIEYSMKPNAERRSFFDELDSLEIDELQFRYLKEKKKNGLVEFIKSILKKIGVFEFIKKMVYKIMKNSYKEKL